MNSQAIDAASAQAGLFRFLLGKRLSLTAGLDRVEPIEPTTIGVWLADGWLTKTEVLTMYSYGHFASRLDSALVDRVTTIRTALGVTSEFADKCEKLWKRASSKLKALNPGSLLTQTPPEVSQAVFQLVAAERMNRQNVARLRLPGLETIVYQHPADRAAMAVFSAIPILPTVIGKSVDFFKNADRVRLLGGAVTVTPESLPAVYKCFAEACEVLNVDPMPPLFVEEGPLGAYTAGVESPYVVLTSAAVTLFTRDELLFVLGHELGHIKAGHVKYQSLGRAMHYVATGAAVITKGLSWLGSELTVMPALSGWSRRCEFTADRAGLLACQDKEVALRTLLKLSGYPVGQYSRLHPRFIVAQARCFGDAVEENWRLRLMNVSNLWQASHPYTVLRAWELLDWVQEGTVEDLLETDADGRRQLAATIEQDPQLAELELEVIRVVTDWAAEHLCLSRHRVRRLLRQMIDRGTSARDTELESILEIQFAIKKTGADEIQCQIHLLINRDGKPTRIGLPVNYAGSWDDVPSSLRQEFIRSGDRELVRKLYSVRATE